MVVALTGLTSIEHINSILSYIKAQDFIVYPIINFLDHLIKFYTNNL